MSSLDLKFIKVKPYKVHRSYSKYQVFWQKMATPTTASTYLAELLTKPIQSEAKKSLKSDDLIELEMISTMYGLALNYQIGDLQGIKSKGDDKSKKSEQSQHPFVQKIINNIFRLFVDQEEIIASVIHQACFTRELIDDGSNKLGPDIFVHYRNIKSLSDHTSTFYQALKAKDLEIIETGEFCFVYEYIVKYMNKNKKQMVPELIQGIINTIKCIKLSIRESPESAQVGACAILHTIRQILTFNPTDEIETLKEFASGIEAFRKWPLPAGLMADTCFKILMNEMRSPGAMLRDYLRENFPLIDFLVNESESSDESLVNIIYCIVEDSFETEDLLSNNSYNLQVEPKLDPHQLRALIISYILSSTCETTKIPISEVISGLSIQEIFIIYTRMLHVLEKAGELNNITECRNLQKTTFNELLKEIINSHQSSSNKTVLTKALKENPSLVAPVPLAFFSPLNKQIDKGKESIMHKRSFSTNFSDRKQPIKDQLLALGSFEHNSNSEKITKIFEISKKPEMPLHESPVKFMLIGGETELFNFLQDLMSIYTSEPHLFRRCDLRIYLAPSSYSSIAQYIASRDHWYQRYIYIPFKENPIIPKMEDVSKSQSDLQGQGKTMSDINSADKRIIFPAIMKENLLQTYVREANYKFAPVVYQIKCYSSALEDTKDVEPNKIIYFTQYVDLGAGILRYKQRIEKKLPPETPFYDLDGNKLIKKFYLDLKIKAEYCEMSGYTHKSEEVVVRSIHDMSISNTPREYSKSTMPFPTSGWLEASYLDFENFKYEDNAMKDKDKFKKLKPEHVNAAFSALYTNIHVKRLSIWSSDKDQTFEILVDGNLCGPCKRIDISPVPISSHPTGLYFTFPIMTFFPIQM